MKQGSLNFFELHLEKFVLGAAGLFTLACVWMYLVNSPNRVEYNGQPVGPGDLDEAVVADARTLERAVQNAKPREEEQRKYAARLRAQHEAGILGPLPKPEPAAPGAAPEPEPPPLAADLALAASFGTPIAIPGQKEEQAKDIVVVTPLKPTAPPVVRTGISMAVRKQVDLAETAAATPAPTPDETTDEGPKPEETPWVTVAAYFDTEAQRTEMTNARYEPYLSRVLFAGVDVERQEQNADGGWSDWASVNDSKAMPKLAIPEPVFDQETGVMVNKDEVEAAYNLVIAHQEALAEPKFYDVSAGDEWQVPPLEGQVVEEEEPAEVMEEDKPEKQPEEREDPTGRTTRARQPQPTGGARTGGRGGGGGMVVGGQRGDRGAAPRPDQSEAQQKRANIKAADTALSNARKAMARKDYDTARQHASEVLSNADAKSATKSAAEKLIADIVKKLAAQSTGPGPVVGPGGRFNRGAAPDPRSGMASPSNQEATELVTHPDKPQQIAVWFHDDTVKSGKTYRYRLRSKLWNRYVGHMRAVKNTDDAKKPVLAGEWSLSSAPVTVAPNTHLFVKGPRGNRQAAAVDVWKWRAGTWIRESFDVAVGDTIGGMKRIKTGETDENDKEVREDVDFSTGAVVLDLRFDERVKVRSPSGKNGEFSYREVTTLVLVYLDPADGQIKERVQALDRDDPVKKKLEREAEEA